MTFESRCYISTKEKNGRSVSLESTVKQELFIFLRTVVQVFFSYLKPLQELEAVGGSLFILLCFAQAWLKTESEYIFFFHCLYYDKILSKQVSAGTTRV